MCECDACVKWHKEARGYNGNLQCTNSDHCICCANSKPPCLQCNHFDALLTDSERIHFHANIGHKNPCDYTDDDWIIVEKMKRLMNQ